MKEGRKSGVTRIDKRRTCMNAIQTTNEGVLHECHQMRQRMSCIEVFRIVWDREKKGKRIGERGGYVGV